MTAILSIAAPIFLQIALAFAAVRSDWIPRLGALAMGRYVLSFALPAPISNAPSERRSFLTLNPALRATGR